MEDKVTIPRKNTGRFSLKNVIDTRESVRLVGRWAWVTTILGVGFAVVVVLTTIFGAPYAYNLLIQTCQDNCFIYGQLTTTNAQDLQAVGISVQAYAIAYIVVLGIFTVACVGLAGLILWKKPGEILPFFAAYFILSLPSDTGSLLFFTNLFNDYPVLGLVYSLYKFPDILVTNFLILTFPTGKFKGKIFFWFFIGLEGTYVANLIYDQLNGNDPSGPTTVFSIVLSSLLAAVTLGVLFYREKNYSLWTFAKYLGFILLCVASVVFAIGLNAIILYILVIYRFQTALTPRERNSTKWLIYAFAVLLFVLTVMLGILPSIPALTAPGTYYFLIFNFLAFFACAINEVGILTGVLYANAFDINLVIKRTLVYSALTLLIAGIYIGSVVGLQALVSAFTGEQNDLAIVGATLVSIVLFQPLRKTIQKFVDRRFYRRKYDAARTIATLNDQLRHEMDLTTLTHSLRGVLNETLQPELVTVWLKKRH